MLTQEIAKTLFDYKDGGLYWRAPQAARVKAGDRAGWVDKRYRRVEVAGKAMLEHRLVYLWHHGTLPKSIDHIDGNAFNNRVENLRPCTQRQNCYNRRTETTSGVKGVCWHKPSNCWRAQMSINGRKTHLGLFSDLSEAAAVVKAAREKHHGEFARG
jgi:hypothetical protein